jgi:tetratricopeptide (TPR) repeat protein
MKTFSSILILILLIFTSCNNKEEKIRTHLNEGIKESYASNIEKARKHFEQVIKLDPKNAEAYYQLSSLEFNLTNYDKALEWIDKAIEIKPNYGEAYRTKAQIYFLKGDRTKACENYKLAEQNGVKNLRNYLQNCN